MAHRTTVNDVKKQTLLIKTNNSFSFEYVYQYVTLPSCRRRQAYVGHSPWSQPWTGRFL